MKKILITGANGFIGKNLTKYLNNKNYDIWTHYRDKLSKPKF